MDRVGRPPEVPVVLVVPAADRRVRLGEADLGEQACIVGRAEPVALRKRALEPAPEEQRRGLPEDRRAGLIRRSHGARERADRFDLVEILGVLLAREIVRPLRAEHLHVGNEERLHVADPRCGVGSRQRRGHPPHAGRGAEDERERRGRIAAVVRACREHGSCGCFSGCDATVLRGACGHGRKCGGVLRSERCKCGGLACRDDREEHAVRRGGDGGICRVPRVHCRSDQVRLVATDDAVDGVVHRSLHHRGAEHRRMSSRVRRENRRIGVRVPLCDSVCACHRGRCERGEHRCAEHDDCDPQRKRSHLYLLCRGERGGRSPCGHRTSLVARVAAIRHSSYPRRVCSA